MQSRYTFIKELSKVHGLLSPEPLLIQNLKDGSKLREALQRDQLERTLTYESDEIRQVTTVIDNDNFPEYTTEFIQSVLKTGKDHSEDGEIRNNLNDVRKLIKYFILEKKRVNALDDEAKSYIEMLEDADFKEKEISTGSNDKLTESSFDEKSRDLFFEPNFEQRHRRNRSSSQESLTSNHETKSFIDELSIIDKPMRPQISGDLYDSSFRDSSSIELLINNSASIPEEFSFFTFQDESKSIEFDHRIKIIETKNVKKKGWKYYFCRCIIKRRLSN